MEVVRTGRGEPNCVWKGNKWKGRREGKGGGRKRRREEEEGGGRGRRRKRRRGGYSFKNTNKVIGSSSLLTGGQ